MPHPEVFSSVYSGQLEFPDSVDVGDYIPVMLGCCTPPWNSLSVPVKPGKMEKNVQWKLGTGARFPVTEKNLGVIIIPCGC